MHECLRTDGISNNSFPYQMTYTPSIAPMVMPMAATPSISDGFTQNNFNFLMEHDEKEDSRPKRGLSFGNPPVKKRKVQ